jgi:diguanylate cyclase (GGDEF)-like protein
MGEGFDPLRALELATEISAGIAAGRDLGETLERIAAARDAAGDGGELRELLASLETIATRLGDPGGLLDRRAFEEAARREVERAYRVPAPLSALALEIDHADRLDAERAGRLVAEVLRRNLRHLDLASRAGETSFRVLLPGADVAGAREVAERCRCAVAALYDADVGAMTATFGVASLPEHAANGAALLQAADAAMRTGARRGRNCVVVALPLAK